MFASSRFYNVILDRKDRLGQKQASGRCNSYQESLNKRNSHPMFQHPIQMNKERDQNGILNKGNVEQQEIVGENQISDNHKRFLEQFKQKLYIIEKNNSAQQRLSNEVKIQKEQVFVKPQLNEDLYSPNAVQKTEKAILASRFSKIDELSQEYLSSKSNQNSQTLKFSHKINPINQENQENRYSLKFNNRSSFNMKGYYDNRRSVQGKENRNYQDEWKLKLIKSQVIDLTKTTKDRLVSNQGANNQDLEVQPYQAISLGGHIGNFKFITEVLKDLGMLTTTQAGMHQEVIIEIAKNRFQQMKQNGKWLKIKQKIQLENILDISNEQQYANQGHQVQFVRKKSSIKSSSFNITNALTATKKVKVISPQTLSQFDRRRQILQRQLIRATQILTNGFSLKKYCYNKYKVQNVRIIFSFDFGFFALKAQDRSKPTIYSTSEFININFGCKSKNFKRYNQRQVQDIPADKAFTITFTDRTFDFVCSSTGQRDEIVSVIKLMKNATL